MKITITGATGFVGINLVPYLKGAYQIKPMSVRYIPHQKFKLDGDVIIHLAGKAHDLKKVSNPADYYEANFQLTKQLFDGFLLSNANVFIFMSTVKAVADEVKGLLSEDEIPNPKTHYGIAKFQAEQYILSHKLPNDKRLYILRPCMIHGPGNKGNLNLLYQLVYKGLPWPLGDFTNQRSFLSIDNLCFVIKELIENTTIASGVYQVSDNNSLSTNQLIVLLGKSLGKKTIILKVNSSFIKFLGFIGDKISLPINSERLNKLTDNYIVSNQKIVEAIGKELPVTLEEGLLKTFKSFKHKKT